MTKICKGPYPTFHLMVENQSGDLPLIPISIPNIKALAQILFEISANEISIYFIKREITLER